MRLLFRLPDYFALNGYKMIVPDSRRSVFPWLPARLVPAAFPLPRVSICLGFRIYPGAEKPRGSARLWNGGNEKGRPSVPVLEK